MTDFDRLVYARCRDGRELVRYDRASKWYVEGSTDRKHVSVPDAAALIASEDGWAKTSLSNRSLDNALAKISSSL